MSREDDLRIYNAPKWSQRRAKAKKQREWFKGTPLLRILDQRDRETGKKMRMFPLGLNLIRLGIKLHRDLSRGVMGRDDPLVITTIVERGEDPDQAEKIESLINEGVWGPSHGGPMLQEALLAANIYGATGFQLAWEPWDIDLPHGLAVRHIADPSMIHPVYDIRNKWRLLEAYIGYEIDPRVAKLRYGITPENEGNPVLYLEHWTPERYRITVDGQVPRIKVGEGKIPLEGENPWGFVPVYYVPLERTIDFFGDSPIPEQEDVTLEFNARATNISDLVRSARPGQLWGTDIQRNPRAIPIKDESGRAMGTVVDLGNTRAHPNANPPKVFPTPMERIPDAIMEFPQVLLDYWMMVARISPAMLGLDDTQSGRITGPAVGNRMWTSVAQAITTRSNFSEAKCVMDRDIIAILKKLEEMGEVDGLDLEGVDRFFGLRQQWAPMLMMDEMNEHTKLIDQLREGGISWEHFLDRIGVEDVDGEITRIKERLEFLAKTKAKEKPQPSEEPRQTQPKEIV